MKNSYKTPLTITLTSLATLATTAVHAESINDISNTDPFSMSELPSGYLHTAQSKETGSGKMKDGSCGEGQCGGAMQQGSEEKTSEGSCAGNKPMPKAKPKEVEGKCGEGKCGTSMSM